MPDLIELDEAQAESLTGVLAAIDTLFTPYRWRHKPGVAAAVDQQRRRYHRRGVAYTVGGGNAERQAGWKLLTELSSMRLIKVHRNDGVRRQVSLTPDGDHQARALCGLPLAHDNVKLLTGKLLDALELHGWNRGYVDERYFPIEVPRLLPLLARGWLVSATDVHGRIGYSLDQLVRPGCKPGSKFHVNGYTVPRSQRLLNASEDAAALYQQLLAAGLSARESWEPDPATEIYIPLPAFEGASK